MNRYDALQMVLKIHQIDNYKDLVEEQEAFDKSLNAFPATENGRTNVNWVNSNFKLQKQVIKHKLMTELTRHTEEVRRIHTLLAEIKGDMFVRITVDNGEFTTSYSKIFTYRDQIQEEIDRICKNTEQEELSEVYYELLTEEEYKKELI